jgi:rubrerythrin
LLARARQLGVDRVPSKAIAAKGKLIDAIAAFVQGTSFEPNGRLWRCLKCGHIFEPKKVPELCPSCFGLKFCRVGG